MLEILNLIKSGKKHSFTGEEVQKLLASDGAANDYFGGSVAISSDNSVLVVGVYGDSYNGTNSGSAYVFIKQPNGTYVQNQMLTASDGAASDRFGVSVSISNDGSVVVVGSNGDDDKGSNSGSVYVFTKQPDGSYTQSQKLTASDGAAQDYFGYTLSISGDSSVIVVGAYQDDDKGTNSGSAYVFSKQSDGEYLQSQKLVANDAAAGDCFGCKVAISTDSSILVIGAYDDDDRGGSSGSAYVFTKESNGNYIHSQKLIAIDGAYSDRFGISVAVSGDGSVLVIGAYFDDDLGTDSGSVYVFTKQSSGLYAQSQKLLASDGAGDDQFGFSVAVSSDGSVIVVGSYGDDDKGSNSGSAYVFTKQLDGSYTQSQKLVASDGDVSDFFGYSVAINDDGAVVVVGSHQDDDKGSGSGSVYIFK